MKQIRKLLFVLLATPFTFSCGEAGVGFDVAAELPIDVGTVEFPIPGTGSPFPPPFPIPSQTLAFNYQLSEVDGFEDALDELNNNRDKVDIFLISISYEFTGINDPNDPVDPDTYDERVPINSIRMDFKNDVTKQIVGSIAITTTGVLDNTPKTPIDISVIKSLLNNELLEGQAISIDFVIEFGEVTPPSENQEVDFDITTYFDAAIRVRDIAN